MVARLINVHVKLKYNRATIFLEIYVHLQPNANAAVLVDQELLKDSNGQVGTVLFGLREGRRVGDHFNRVSKYSV